MPLEQHAHGGVHAQGFFDAGVGVSEVSTAFAIRDARGPEVAGGSGGVDFGDCFSQLAGILEQVVEGCAEGYGCCIGAGEDLRFVQSVLRCGRKLHFWSMGLYIGCQCHHDIRHAHFVRISRLDGCPAGEHVVACALVFHLKMALRRHCGAPVHGSVGEHCSRVRRFEALSKVS